jgi:Flp pilus assembly protein TadG
MRRRTEGGQVIVEYAIVFPILLLLTLLIIQLAHLFVAKQVVSYASFCAARAALVGEDYAAAARMVCSLIAGPSGVGTGATVTVPGWGPLRGSAASAVKTQAASLSNVPTPYPATTIEVTHDFELQVPVANSVTYSLGEIFLESGDLDYTYGVPHIRIRSRSTLSRPWSE